MVKVSAIAHFKNGMGGGKVVFHITINLIDVYVNVKQGQASEQREPHATRICASTPTNSS